MNIVNEFASILKTLDRIDDLKKEKLENEKIINEINEEDKSVSVIEKELESLNIKMHNFKFIKVAKPISYAFSFVFLVAVITLFISTSVINLSNNNIVDVLILSTFLGAPFPSLVKLYFGELSKTIGYHSLEEIQKLIEEKEQQKELIKSKSETNKEILTQKEQRQIEIDKEMEACTSRVHQYVDIAKQFFNLNNSEFLQASNSLMQVINTEDEKGNAYQKRK